MTRLSDIMTSPASTAPPQISVAEAADTMVRCRFGSVLIVQGSLLTGILTERDVLRAAASGVDPTRSPASRWMTSDPETAGPETDVEQAAELMLASGFLGSISSDHQRQTVCDRERDGHWVRLYVIAESGAEGFIVARDGDGCNTWGFVQPPPLMKLCEQNAGCTDWKNV